MPPREVTYSRRPREYRKKEYRRTRYRPQPSSTNQDLRLGLEVGTLGRKNNAGSNVLGMQLLWGGRGYAFWPIHPQFILKPSLGYFFKTEGTSQVGVTQHNIEIGASALYAPWPDHEFQWNVGIAQRIDVLFGKISAFNASNTSAAGFRYRAGAVNTFHFPVSNRFKLGADLEIGMAFSSPIKPYAGLTAGFMFEI